jgi:hypothetical protein
LCLEKISAAQCCKGLTFSPCKSVLNYLTQLSDILAPVRTSNPRNILAPVRTFNPRNIVGPLHKPPLHCVLLIGFNPSFTRKGIFGGSTNYEPLHYAVFSIVLRKRKARFATNDRKIT